MSEPFEPIIVEEVFNTTIDQLWDAITKVDQMKQWYFAAIESFDPVIGFETKFNVKSGKRNFLHLWKLTEVVPLKKIVYNWKYEDYVGDSFVTFELSNYDNRTKLTLTHAVVENFPQDIPEFLRESGVEGWNYFIRKSLKEFLEKIK
jgi:uncharacterized protein YndB with AHSA1/START domain